MNYPIEILPNRRYKKIVQDISKFCLVRHIDGKFGTNELIDAATGKIKVEHIANPREHISDLSTSLLSVFKIEHNYISLTDSGKLEYNKECDPNEHVVVPIYQEHFTLNKNKSFWFVKIEDLFDKEITVELDRKTSYIVKCIVIHTPMKWNFWHFSVRWIAKDSNNNEVKLTRAVYTNARVMLSQYSFIIEPNYSVIEKSYYCQPFFSVTTLMIFYSWVKNQIKGIK